MCGRHTEMDGCLCRLCERGTANRAEKRLDWCCCSVLPARYFIPPWFLNDYNYFPNTNPAYRWQQSFNICQIKECLSWPLVYFPQQTLAKLDKSAAIWGPGWFLVFCFVCLERSLLQGPGLRHPSQGGTSCTGNSFLDEQCKGVSSNCSLYPDVIRNEILLTINVDKNVLLNELDII